MANFVTCNQLNAALGNYQEQLRDCDGSDLAAGTQVATCQNLDDAIAAIPTDKFLGAIGHSYDAATNTLHLELNDGSIVNVDMTALIADVTTGLQPQLRNCAGANHAANAQVPTCAEMSAADAALQTAITNWVNGQLASYQGQLRDCAGANLPANAQVVTCGDIASPSSPLGTALAGKQDALRNCAGAPLPANTQVATCADLPVAATLQEVIDGTGTDYVNATTAHDRLNIPVFGAGALANRGNPTWTAGVAIGYNALNAHDGATTYDVAVGHEALKVHNPTALTNVGASVAVGAGAGASYNPTQNGSGSMSFLGQQAGLAVVDGKQSTLVGGAGVNYTSPLTTDNVVAVGQYALGVGRLSQPVTVRGAVAIGTGAGSRRLGGGSANYLDANTSVGTGAGSLNVGEQPSSAYVTSVGAFAGTNAWGQHLTAVGNSALRGGLGYYATAVGSLAGLGNVSAATSFLGYNTREQAGGTLFGTHATTTGYAEDAQSLYYDNATAGTLPVQGTPVTLQFFSDAACSVGAELGGFYTGVVQAGGTRVRFATTNPDLTAAAPYDGALVQGCKVTSRPFYTNSTAVGANAIISAANTVYLGDANVTAVRSQGAFYSAGTMLTSDARLKRDVTDIDLTAARLFVKGLRFVKYTKVANYIAKRRQLEQQVEFARRDANAAALAAAQAALDAFATDSPEGQPGSQEAGLIAQEVQALAALHGFEYVVHEDTDGVLSLDYNSIQAIINAVVIDSITI